MSNKAKIILIVFTAVVLPGFTLGASSIDQCPTVSSINLDQLNSVEAIQARIDAINNRISCLNSLLGEDGSDFTPPVVNPTNNPANNNPDNQNLPSQSIGDVIDLKHNLSRGKTDEDTDGEVSVLQNYLASEDFYGFPITGKFDHETYLSVIEFQNEYAKYLGIKRGTGYVGPATRKLIKTLTSGGNLDSLITTKSSKPTQKQTNAQSNSSTVINTVADLPAPSLIYPTGGEKWPLGSYQGIKWNGTASTYDIYVGNQKIASGVVNNNFFWRVGQIGSTTPLQVAQIYKLKVCNQNSNKCSDERTFQIIKNNNIISYRISTDKYAYNFNEGIRVSITARNNDSVRKTLNFDTNCQVNYKIYSLDIQKTIFDYARTQNCAKQYTYVDIDPNGSYSWFMYHDTSKYRLNPGNYVFRAEVDGTTVASTDVTIQ